MQKKASARRRVFVPPDLQLDAERAPVAASTPRKPARQIAPSVDVNLTLTRQESTDLLGALLDAQERATADATRYEREGDADRAAGAAARGARVAGLLRRVAELVMEAS